MVCDGAGAADEDGRGMVPGASGAGWRAGTAGILLRFRIGGVSGAESADAGRSVSRGREADGRANLNPYSAARSSPFFFSRNTSAGSLPASTATSNQPIIISSQV